MSASSNSFAGKTVSGGWKIENFMTAGSYGSLFTVRRKDGTRGIIQIEHFRLSYVRRVVRVLRRLQGLSGFAKLYSSGTLRTDTYDKSPMFVMQHLGRSVESLMKSYRFTITDLLKLGIQMVERLRDIHRRGFLHRDIQVRKILTGDPREGEARKLYLIDFGTSVHVKKSIARHRYGSVLFSSTAALGKETYGRIDDLKSLV